MRTVSGELLLFRTRHFLSLFALARLLPKGAAVPLMGIYEQHPCQETEALKRCDMLRRGGCRNVTRRTICGRFSGSKIRPC